MRRLQDFRLDVRARSVEVGRRALSINLTRDAEFRREKARYSERHQHAAFFDKLRELGGAGQTHAATHIVGLYVASAVYLAFYMRWVGHHRWLTVVVVAIGIPVVTFVVFEQWFLVPMPKGPLEAWLGY